MARFERARVAEERAASEGKEEWAQLSNAGAREVEVEGGSSSADFNS